MKNVLYFIVGLLFMTSVITLGGLFVKFLISNNVALLLFFFLLLSPFFISLGDDIVHIFKGEPE